MITRTLMAKDSIFFSILINFEYPLFNGSIQQTIEHKKLIFTCSNHIEQVNEIGIE